MQAGQAGLSGSLAGPRQQRKPWVPRVRGRGFPADGERSAVSQAGVGEPRVCSCGTPGGAGEVGGGLAKALALTLKRRGASRM